MKMAGRGLKPADAIDFLVGLSGEQYAGPNAGIREKKNHHREDDQQGSHEILSSSTTHWRYFRACCGRGSQQLRRFRAQSRGGTNTPGPTAGALSGLALRTGKWMADWRRNEIVSFIMVRLADVNLAEARLSDH
jgi:hypothetical protein